MSGWRDASPDYEVVTPALDCHPVKDMSADTPAVVEMLPELLDLASAPP